MSTTTVLLRNEIDQNIRILLDSTEEKVDDMLHHRLSFLYGENLIPALPIDTLRVITEMVSDDSKCLAIKNLLVNTIVTSENLWAGSGIISLLVLLEAGKVFQKNKSIGLNPAYSFDKINTSACANSRRANSKEIFSALKKLSRSNYEFELAKVTLDLAGSSSAHISNKVGLNTVVTVDKGYTFKVGPTDLFWSASEASLVSLYNSKVVCIDGIVESISEIHSIMDKSFSTGQSTVLFARGFHDDVVNTLAVNHSRGKLNVIPVVIPYDIMGVNQLVDIAVCSGCDVVSSIKGELISTIEWDDLVEVDRIVISKKGVVIENEDSLKRVANHKKQIQRKLSSTFRDLNADEEGMNSEQLTALEESRKNQRDVYQERIMSLMSGGAKITLGKEHGSSRGIKQDRVSTILRMFGQASKHGLTDLQKCSGEKIDPIADQVVRKLVDFGILEVTPPALICGFRIGIANALMMNKIGAWLAIDEK